MIVNSGRAAVSLAAALAATALAGGCDAMPWFSARWTSPPAVKQKVPAPIDHLLPREIVVQGWTGTRVFAEHGGIEGIDVRIQAKDAFGDFTKAFGAFRFELYHYRSGGQDRKGDRIAVWSQPVLAAKDNLEHWDKYLPGYHFKLGLENQAIPVGWKVAPAAMMTISATTSSGPRATSISGQTTLKASRKSEAKPGSEPALGPSLRPTSCSRSCGSITRSPNRCVAIIRPQDPLAPTMATSTPRSTRRRRRRHG